MVEVIIGFSLIAIVASFVFVLGALATLFKKERMKLSTVLTNGFIMFVVFLIVLFVSYILGGIFI